MAVGLFLLFSGVDDVLDSGHGETGLCHISTGHDHSRVLVVLEDLRLLLGSQLGEKREYLERLVLLLMVAFGHQLLEVVAELLLRVLLLLLF